MEFDETQLLRIIVEQAITIRNLKIKLRIYEGEYYPDEDYNEDVVGEIVARLKAAP